MPDARSGTGIAPRPRRRCRVFVSYAHLDARPVPGDPQPNGLVGRFLVELKNIRSLLADQGKLLHEDEVFFDRDRLNRAERWGAAIGQAIDECEVVVLLVSSHSLASDFCTQREVGPAVARGARLLTVVLRAPTDGWIQRRVAGTAYGDFASGGLPKDLLGNTLAVTSWANLDEAWASVSRDLRPFLEEHLFVPAGAPPEPVPAPMRQERPTGTPSRPPLPYFCNQDDTITAFENAADEWQRDGARQAQIVVLPTQHDDGPEHFADRLLARHIARRLRAAKVTPPQELNDRLQWPGSPPASAQFKDAKPLLRALFDALDEDELVPRLAGCNDLAGAGRLLAEHLAGREQAAVLLTWLPRRDVRKDLQVLQRCIDAADSRGNEFAKLVLLCVDEARVSEWPRRPVSGTHARLLVLEPLVEIEASHLETWHRAHHVDPHIKLADLLTRFAQVAAGGRQRARLLADWLAPYCKDLRAPSR